MKTKANATGNLFCTQHIKISNKKVKSSLTILFTFNIPKTREWFLPLYRCNNSTWKSLLNTVCIFNVSGNWFHKKSMNPDLRSATSFGQETLLQEIILNTMAKMFKFSQRNQLKEEGFSMDILLTWSSIKKITINSKEGNKFL